MKQTSVRERRKFDDDDFAVEGILRIDVRIRGKELPKRGSNGWQWLWPRGPGRESPVSRGGALPRNAEYWGRPPGEPIFLLRGPAPALNVRVRKAACRKRNDAKETKMSRRHNKPAFRPFQLFERADTAIRQ